MELRHLRYYLAVTEELNLTRAAARLHVAQPALSRQMKDLEEALGTPLFTRSKAGVSLTRAGETFRDHSVKIIAQVAVAVEATQKAAGVMAGKITIGFLGGLFLKHLNPILEEFRVKFPAVEFDFVQATRAAQHKSLHAGRLDIAFTNVLAVEELPHLVILHRPSIVVLHRRHRLAKKKLLTLREIEGEDFVFSTREARPEFYDTVFKKFAAANFHPRVVKEMGGPIENVLGMVSLGLGLSIVPEFTDTTSDPNLVWIHLKQPVFWQDFGLFWRPDESSPRVLKLLELARKSVEGRALK